MRGNDLPSESGSRAPANAEARSIIGPFGRELALYVVLVAIYFFAVLRFLGGWLFRLSASNRWVYAFVSIGLMLGQGLLLDVITTGLLRLMQRRTRR